MKAMQAKIDAGMVETKLVNAKEKKIVAAYR